MSQSPQPPLRLTRAQVREIDRRSIEEYHVPGVVLMENAARAVVDVAAGVMSPGGRVLIVCGGGNNGGDGFAVARHLHNRGHAVSLVSTVPADQYRGDALANLQIVRAMNLPLLVATPELIAAPQFDLIIDAVFGTGLTAAPRDAGAAAIDAMNRSAAPKLAVDLPSGLDCDTGRPLGPSVRAAWTVTFVAEKVGFANPEAAPYLGRVTVGDIGCPREAIDAVVAAGLR